MNLRENLPVVWSNRPTPTTDHKAEMNAVKAAAARVIDYRDRISVVTWLFVFGLGISQIYTLPTTLISLRALGSPMSIALTRTLVAALFLALLAAAGTESVVSIHPRFAASTKYHFIRSWPFWALPMAIAIIAVYLLPLAPTRAIQILTIVAGGVLLAVALFLHVTVERGQSGFRRARFILDALAYGAALLLFLFVYQTRTRSLLSGTLVAMTATLLAVEILRTTTERSLVVLTYGAIVGVILGQVTWALNYWWTLTNLNGGLLLLLTFYLVVGIAQYGIQDHLNRRILWEFAIFAIVALILIAVIGPRFG
ncbi:MAG: hypothetical protein R2867_05755 [Caldilineaceae bacterium]